MLSKPGLRRLFWCLVIMALVGNVVTDIFLSKESSQAAAAGEWVRRSYMIIQELDRTAAEIAQLRTFASDESQEFKNHLADLLTHLHRLGALTVDTSNEGRYVLQLQTLMAQRYRKEVYDEARTVLRKMRTEEDQILLARLRDDEKQTQLAHREMQWGSVLDTALMVLLILIYWFDMKSKQKTEALLRDTVQMSEAANARLESLSQSRFDLLRTTAHDLKNPLGSIMGFVDIIHSERSDQDTVRVLTERIQRISKETLELVGRLIEPTGASLQEPVDLRDVLEQLHQQNEALAWSKHQRLEFEIPEALPILIKGDRVKVREIFQNLISNAIKFSPMHGRISIRVRALGNKAHIEIQDEGPGFTALDKEKAFGRNQRLTAQPTGGESSTGLGLSIVKEFIESHRASIHIADAPGGGALFQIDWPLV